jgi:hypothetical protein
LKNLIYLEQKFANKEITRFITWEVYRLLNNINLAKHDVTNYFVEINDFTDDFDFPNDYNGWIRNLENYYKKTKINDMSYDKFIEEL